MSTERFSRCGALFLLLAARLVVAVVCKYYLILVTEGSRSRVCRLKRGVIAVLRFPTYGLLL